MAAAKDRVRAKKIRSEKWMAKRLANHLERQERVVLEKLTSKSVVAKLGMSGANDNEKARRVLNLYLEGLVGCADISDDDARAAISILKEVATSFQKDLCNKILTKYLGKFDAFFPKAKTTAAVMEAAPAGKAEAVAA